MRLLNPGYDNNEDSSCTCTFNSRSGTYDCDCLNDILVNNSLYWNKGTGTVYTEQRNVTTPDISFTNTGLTAKERNLIDNAVWYTGAYDNFSYVDAHYNAERGSMGKICSGGNWCNDTVERTSTWNGKVGLIYPSDLGYAADLSSCNQTLDEYYNCSNSNWLVYGRYDWTLSSRADSGNASNVFLVSHDGNLNHDYASTGLAVRPAVFLKSGVSISGGNGSESNPFVLG